MELSTTAHTRSTQAFPRLCTRTSQFRPPGHSPWWMRVGTLDSEAVMDELDARVRSLEAERLRPVPPRPRTGPVIDQKALAELLAEAGEGDEETAEGEPGT